MTKIAPAITFAVAVLCLRTVGFAQDTAQRVAIINIQQAIAASSDGQEAARQLQTRFAPKRSELETLQKEVNDLQNQLRNQERTLSEEARTRLMRNVDEKTRAFNRANEDATAEFQQAEQDAINEIGRKMMGIIDEYAKQNKYTLIIDVSSPQTPVLYADSSADITPAVIELYNNSAAKPAVGGAPASSAAPAAAPAAPPAAAPPAARPATPPPAAQPPAGNP
jgi:outer membrane protein